MFFRLPAILNGIALALMFPVTMQTLLSIKFWVVLALMAAACTIANHQGYERK